MRDAKRRVVELILFSIDCLSFLGQQCEFLARSALSSIGNCEEIAFAFTFINRKCDLLLVAMAQHRTCSSAWARHFIISYPQSLHHGFGYCASRSHVNVTMKLKLTLNRWDNPVNTSMPQWQCRHARSACSTRTEWTRPNARDKLYLPPIRLTLVFLSYSVIFPFCSPTHARAHTQHSAFAATTNASPEKRSACRV